MAETFTTSLTVDKRIVPLLSKSTYQRSFPYAVRELVSNAYDADATSVRIDVNLDTAEIVVEDDGNGMSIEEFKFYLTIAGQKRGKRNTSKYGRRRIGQLGVGFLAIFPFCQTLEITSTVENSDIVFRANIPATRFFSEAEKLETVEQIPVTGLIQHDPKMITRHFTRVKLVRPTDLVSKYFANPDKTSKRNTIRSWKPMDRFKWELEEDLPIEYPPESPLNGMMKYDQPLPLEVNLNGKKLFRNVGATTVLESGTEEVSGIRFQYYIATDFKGVSPEEARGLKLRLNNVGVGERRDFNLKRAKGYAHLHWLTGEVHILEGLDESVTLSRDDFIWSMQYQDMEERLAKLLAKQSTYLDATEESFKEMRQQLASGKQIKVASRREVVLREMKKLEARGFRVENPVIGGNKPIEIDRERKIIHFSADHPDLEDSITIAGKKREVVFSSWKPKSGENAACKVRKSGIIEINQDYPLFQSKRYGELFKKILILMALAREECETVEEMYRYISMYIDKDFQDFT